MEGNSIIHGMWIGKSLSPIELLTLKSFIDHGHIFHLWAYDAIDNVPGEVVVKDASTVIPHDQVFNYRHKNSYGHGKGSYAGFSDIFRYKLLYDHGGIYVDMDITCLKAFDFKSDYVFRAHHKFGSVGNIMKCPKGSEVMDWCYIQASEKVTQENRRWELPIEILNEGIHRFGFSQQIKTLSNIDSWPVVAHHISGSPDIPDDWYAIHWMNEEWRRLNLKKDNFVVGSNLYSLLKKHGVKCNVQKGISAVLTKVRLSRPYYLAKNVISRLF